MKKIALTLAAVSALGLAACEGRNEANNTADNAAVENEAVEDVNASEAAQDALNTMESATENAVEAGENAIDAVGEAADNATN